MKTLSIHRAQNVRVPTRFVRRYPEDTVNSTQVCTFIKQETKKRPNMSADELADALVKRAIRFRTQDNVAVVVVDMKQPSAA